MRGVPPEGGVDVVEACEALAIGGRELVPGGDVRVPRREARPRRDDPELLLALVPPPPGLVPAVVVAAAVLAAVGLRHLVRTVARPEGEGEEERPVQTGRA